MKNYKTPDSFMYSRGEFWKELELLTKKRFLNFDDSMRLSSLYREIVEDLSFVQTEFEDAVLSNYLNTIILKAGGRMYRKDTLPFSGFFSLFTEQLPQAFKFVFKEFIFSLIIFLFVIVIGSGLILENPEYAELLLFSDIYQHAVNDLENLNAFKNFDNIPEDSRVNMSFYIWLNNSKVALFAFVTGITAGIGTFILLIVNSMMISGLGVIYYLNGHFVDFFSIIMVHGSLELPAIFLSTASGFAIGKALLFPGRRKRKVLLKEAVRKSFIIFIGVVIILFFAGLIEGLITTRKPDVYIRFLIAFVNISIFSGYYIYSIKKNPSS